MVAVDGAKARAVREQKKLTQLYVASVVGVTTDTISRWENNRYPTIKRENADKLAEALEIPVEEIVRMEEPAPSLPEPKPGIRRAPVVAAVLFITVAVAAILFLLREPAPPRAERLLPPFAAPGETVPVRIRVVRGPGSRGFIIKEHLPAGWRLVKAFPPTFGEGVGEVKWLIPEGNGAVTISYTVRAPAETAASSFEGTVGVHADGVTKGERIAGGSAVSVDGHHWADTNGDGRIDDNEIMPAYYLTEEMKELGLDWKTIETIWSGRGYRWDAAGKTFQVVR